MDNYTNEDPAKSNLNNEEQFEESSYNPAEDVKDCQDQNNEMENQNSPLNFNDKNKVNENDISVEDDLNNNNIEYEYSEETIIEIQQKATDYKNIGNNYYKKKEYLEALNVYLQAIKLILQEYIDDIPPNHYFNNKLDSRLKETLGVVFMNRGLCFKNLNEKDKAIDMFSKSLLFDPTKTKSLYQRLELLYEKGDYIEAQEDYIKLKASDSKLLYEFKVNEFTVNYKAEEKKKQMTQQMMGQLKDVGNSLLGLFGLSVDNFQVNQQDGGGYNIQFKN